MKKRLVIVLLILAGGPLVLLLVWVFLAEQFRTAEVTLAARSQPLEEIVVTGFVKNAGARGFSLETLLIEEPGKEPYHRKVALDGDDRFEVMLGKPRAGKYRCGVQTKKSQWGKVVQEGWATTPYLVVDDGGRGTAMVRVKDYDYQRLFVWLGCGLGVWVVVLIASAAPLVRRRPT